MGFPLVSTPGSVIPNVSISMLYCVFARSTQLPLLSWVGFLQLFKSIPYLPQHLALFIF